MKYLNMSFVMMLMLLFTNCKKSSDGSGSSSTTDVAPTNLTVAATVNSDKSGSVAFTASATNAASYDYDFGNGVYQTVASGVVTYKYTTAGTYSVNVVAKSAGGQTISKSISVTVVVNSSLLFSEDFDTPGAPDPTKWGYDIGTGSGGWGNSELEYYTNRSDNVIISNGTLKITAKKEAYSGSAYTSARIQTQGKFKFTYGKMEIRAKLPAGGGTWPAIWLLGSDVTTNAWPACGEIDIMEHKGNDLGRIFGTLHYPNHSGGNGDGGNTVIPGVTTDFHRYQLEWNATSVKIGVDDVVYKTVANTPTLPFNHDFFIILNFAMGGTFGGAVDPNFSSATMEVDYIHITQ
jgi:hypothetical protein